MKVTVHARWVLAIALWFAAATAAKAEPAFFTDQCAGCHVTPTFSTSTCAGCHAHGVHSGTSKSDINLKGTTNQTSYAPGATVSVTISGGYRSGWVRAILYDQTMKELARSTGTATGGMGGGSGFPITLTGPAPTTPGTYTWNVAWYGNEYDTGTYGSRWTPDPGNPGHGREIVSTNSFTVTAPATSPAIALNPGTLAFGNVNVGSTGTLTSQIQNTGTAALTVTAIGRCSGTSTEFAWTSSALPLTIAAGSSALLTATYAPTAGGADSGCLAITSNASNGATTNLNVSGSGVVPAAPKVAVTPTSLSFGNVTVTASTSKTFTVTNGGTAPLTGTVARATATSAEYTVSPATLNVAPGASQAVTVTYAPADTTTDSGTIVVATNDPTSPSVNVAVSGAGVPAPAPAIALSPTSLSFGTVTVGGSATLSAQVQNTGTAALTVSAISLCASPATSSEFSWSPAGPLSIAPGGSATVSVRYAPSAAGADAGCIAFASNDAARPVANLNVSGTGQLAAAPKIAVSPATLSFGNVTVKTASSKTFTVSNSGNATLTGTIAAGAGTSGEYAVSPATLSVAAGATQVVTVIYTPVDVGADAGSVVIASNDATAPSTVVSLSGAGVAAPAPAIAVDPPSLGFGTVALGNAATLTTQVRNAGTATLNVTGIAPCAGTSTEFTSSTVAPIAVAAGQSATVSVSYRPAAEGTDSGCFEIASDDAAHPTVSLAVTGAGAAAPAAVIALNPTSIDFGSVTVGSAASRTAQVKNGGNATLEISGVSLCSGTSSEFAVSPAGPLSVAPGASATLTLTYGPASEGADSGCIAIASNDATTPTSQLAVAGAGAAPQPPASAVVDVDIRNFQVPGRVDSRRTRTVAPVLRAKNNGTASGAATATLVGELNGTEVYRQTLSVSLDVAAAGEFPFPVYSVPADARGTVAWTLTIDDGDPDVDTATATTWLGGYRGQAKDPLEIRPTVADVEESSVAAAPSPAAGGCSTGSGGMGLVGIAAAVAALVATKRRSRARRG